MTAIGTVRLDGRALLISELHVNDPDVVDAARQALACGEALEEFMRHALRLGVAALAAVNRGADLARLEQALAAVDGHVEQTVKSAVGEVQRAVQQTTGEQAQRLSSATTDAVDRLSRGVQALVAGQDGLLARNVQASVQALVDQTGRSLQEVIHAQARSTQAALDEERDRVRTALMAQSTQHHQEVRQSLDGIRERLLELDVTRKVRATTAARGDDHEQSVLQLIQRIARSTGDLAGVEHTGRITGADGTLKGDVVVTLTSVDADSANPPRICWEAKDKRKSNRMSANALAKELRLGRSNRASSCSVAVLTPEAMPLPGHKIVLLEPRSICVAWEPGDDDDLPVAAFQLMKLLAISEAADAGRAVDPARLRRHLADLMQTVERFSDMEKEIGRADKAVGNIRGMCTDLRADLVRRLDDLHRTVIPDRKSDAPGDEPQVPSAA